VQTMTLKFFRATLVRVHCTTYIYIYINIGFSRRLFRSRRVGVKLAIARAGDSWKV